VQHVRGLTNAFAAVAIQLLERHEGAHTPASPSVDTPASTRMLQQQGQNVPVHVPSPLPSDKRTPRVRILNTLCVQFLIVCSMPIQMVLA
jgi:hypothetical protein